LTKLDANGKTLVVSAAQDKNLFLASRNIATVELTTSNDMNTYQVLKYDKLVFTKGALEKVQERLSL
jgi:large subunit ribosomal protein L4